MNPIVRWDPFRDKTGASEWIPTVDISEDEKEYLVTTDLPEMRKDDIKVTVENGTLAISGERKVDREQKTKKFLRTERAYGSFLRSFSLPENVDPSKVSADYKDGILKIHMAKKEGVKPKGIEVKVS